VGGCGQSYGLCAAVSNAVIQCYTAAAVRGRERPRRIDCRPLKSIIEVTLCLQRNQANHRNSDRDSDPSCNLPNLPFQHGASLPQSRSSCAEKPNGFLCFRCAEYKELQLNWRFAS